MGIITRTRRVWKERMFIIGSFFVAFSPFSCPGQRYDRIGSCPPQPLLVEYDCLFHYEYEYIVRVTYSIPRNSISPCNCFLLDAQKNNRLLFRMPRHNADTASSHLLSISEVEVIEYRARARLLKHLLLRRRTVTHSRHHNVIQHRLRLRSSLFRTSSYLLLI